MAITTANAQGTIGGALAAPAAAAEGAARTPAGAAFAAPAGPPTRDAHLESLWNPAEVANETEAVKKMKEDGIAVIKADLGDAVRDATGDCLVRLSVERRAPLACKAWGSLKVAYVGPPGTIYFGTDSDEEELSGVPPPPVLPEPRDSILKTTAVVEAGTWWAARGTYHLLDDAYMALPEVATEHDWDLTPSVWALRDTSIMRYVDTTTDPAQANVLALVLPEECEVSRRPRRQLAAPYKPNLYFYAPAAIAADVSLVVLSGEIPNARDDAPMRERAAASPGVPTPDEGERP